MKRYLLIFALILSIGVTSVLPFFDVFQEAEALKSSGNFLTEIGSKKVCGDRLCTEIGENSQNLQISVPEMVMNQQSAVSPSTYSDPLPSWNDENSKQKIIEFVDKVTNSSLPTFVRSEDRIATFDNDGTLWIEQPLYIPFAFHLEYLHHQIKSEPSLSSQSPYSEVLAKGDSITNEDLEHISGLMDTLLPAYPYITQEEYLQKSKDYLDNTKHVKYNISLKELTYLPMVELVSYLQENDFKVYLVSAGFQGLMRSVSEEIYNIDKENVIGTHPEFVYELTENGPAVIRQPILDSFNDGAEKPANIQKFIGKVPIFACGNSGGDIEMLMLTHYHENHFACMVNHDDENREYYYHNQEALDASQRNDWIVISMKNDFKTIFSDIPKEIEYECSSDFWKNNLELWDKVGLDYNDDFDETFGKDYFNPDITLEQAINMEGVGMNHLARSGTAAYLNALVDPEIDEEIVRIAVNFGYVHQIDRYIENCKNIEQSNYVK
ncbi:MAG: haloacid dehalogenase-like hydrolase [Nitrosopumilus sp.]|nr:haloacid dehalogenase-like hydrolase [Nitrosopumilus sp.]